MGGKRRRLGEGGDTKNVGLDIKKLNRPRNRVEKPKHTFYILS